MAWWKEAVSALNKLMAFLVNQQFKSQPDEENAEALGNAKAKKKTLRKKRKIVRNEDKLDRKLRRVNRRRARRGLPPLTRDDLR